MLAALVQAAVRARDLATLNDVRAQLQETFADVFAIVIHDATKGGPRMDGDVVLRQVGGLEMQLEKIVDRWVAQVTIHGQAKEALNVGDSQAVTASMNAQKAKEMARRLYRLGDAIEALDAGDDERMERIVALLNNPDLDTEELI